MRFAILFGVFIIVGCAGANVDDAPEPELSRDLTREDYRNAAQLVSLNYPNIESKKKRILEFLNKNTRSVINFLTVCQKPELYFFGGNVLFADTNCKVVCGQEIVARNYSLYTKRYEPIYRDKYCLEKRRIQLDVKLISSAYGGYNAKSRTRSTGSDTFDGEIILESGPEETAEFFVLIRSLRED